MGSTGRFLFWVYYVFLITLSALAVIGISKLAYVYHVDVTHGEAKILSRGIAECLFGEGVLHLDRISDADREAILEYCGYTGNLDRLYVFAQVFREDNQNESVATFRHGDEGSSFIRNFFEAVGGLESKHVPGRINDSYELYVVQGTDVLERVVGMEVIVHNEV